MYSSYSGFSHLTILIWFLYFNSPFNWVTQQRSLDCLIMTHSLCVRWVFLYKYPPRCHSYQDILCPLSFSVLHSSPISLALCLFSRLLSSQVTAVSWPLSGDNVSGLGSCSLGYTSGDVTVYNSGDLALLVLLSIWRLTLGDMIILYVLYWQPLRIIVSSVLDYTLCWLWTCRGPLRFLCSKLAALRAGL